jgi:Tfp pilus assembly protein FimT
VPALNTVEVIAVLALVALLVTVTVLYSVPLLAKNAMRSTVIEVRGVLRTAQAESLARNRPTRFVIDTQARAIEVWDGRQTATTSDDELLLRHPLSPVVRFVRPDAGDAVTLQPLGGPLFQAVFTPNGAVSAGVGSVHLSGGERFERLTVLGSGSIQTEAWTGTSWQPAAF